VDICPTDSLKYEFVGLHRAHPAATPPPRAESA